MEQTGLFAGFLDSVGTHGLLDTVPVGDLSHPDVGQSRRPDFEMVNHFGFELLVRDIGNNEFWIIVYDVNGDCLGCGIINDFVHAHINLHKLNDFSSVRSISIEELFFTGE